MGKFAQAEPRDDIVALLPGMHRWEATFGDLRAVVEATSFYLARNAAAQLPAFREAGVGRDAIRVRLLDGGNSAGMPITLVETEDDSEQSRGTMIRKKGKGYVATTESGRLLSKKAKTKKAARKQLAAVEISKARRGK